MLKLSKVVYNFLKTKNVVWYSAFVKMFTQSDGLQSRIRYPVNTLLNPCNMSYAHTCIILQYIYPSSY